MAKLTKSAREVRGRKMLTVKLKEAKYHSSSSNRWLERQLNDPYVAESKRLGYRSRASFKLIQLDEKYKFFVQNNILLTLLFDESSDTFLSIGLFLLQQKSAVISVAPVANTLQNNYGLQINPVLLGTVTDNNYGISFGLENYCKNCYGIQIGVLNHSFAGDEICKENERFQFCGVNIADAVYLGIANFSNEFQIGLFNFSKEATFQLGLLNYNPKSHIPWLPLVNWDMGREEQ